MRRFLLFYSTLSIIVAIIATAQEPKKTIPMTASGRLAAARTAYVKNAGGNSIPFRVINSAIEGWGRFTLVDTPDKADIIVEVSAPDEGGVSMSSSMSRSPVTGGETQSTTTTRRISGGQVKMAVLDGKSKAVLWTASEQPKFAMKQKAKEDNLVEAAQRLVAKFRERIEAPPAQ